MIATEKISNKFYFIWNWWEYIKQILSIKAIHIWRMALSTKSESFSAEGVFLVIK